LVQNRWCLGPRIREALAAIKGNIIDTTGDKIGDLKVEYLREFEAIFFEKTRGRKSRDTVPLKIGTMVYFPHYDWA
jgi:hypothetical protein